MRGALAWLIALSIMGGIPAAQRPQLELRPIDQAATQPEFFTYRARLQAAVARHDVDAIVSMSSPDIRVTFGDSGGAASWRRMLADTDAALWGQLAETLALGGTFQNGGSFVAPYVYSAWPDGLDAFEYVAVVGERVAVRSQPNAASSIVMTLSYALVPVGAAGEKAGMTEIRLADGRGGYVATRFLRSSVGYRALFNRVGGRWVLTAFVSGD